MFKRILLLTALLVCFAAFVIVVASAQSTSTTDTVRSPSGADSTTTTVLTNNSTITIGLMLVLLGLAISVGSNWQKMRGHIAAEDIHLTTDDIAAKHPVREVCDVKHQEITRKLDAILQKVDKLSYG